MHTLKRFSLAVLCASTLAGQTPPPPAAPSGEIATNATPAYIEIPEPGRFKNLFMPFRTENAALSPDGKYLAYSVREDDKLSVVVIDIDHPEKATARVLVATDESATTRFTDNQFENTPARINWMRWTTPTRVVVETNQVSSRSAGAAASRDSWHGTILGFDANGGNARVLAKPADLMEYTRQPLEGSDVFSIRRNTNPRFNSRVWLADMPVPAAGDDSLPPVDPTMAPRALTGDPAVPDARLTSESRSLRVFDLDSRRPGAVTLVSTDGSATKFYSLDSISGKLTLLDSDIVLAREDAMMDRQGHVRLTVPNTLTTDFPHKYFYLGANGASRPKPLDLAAGVTAGSRFSVSPDDFFGERAIPVGFDENPNILYYAANTGRDTYGLYSIDLSTGHRGGLVMENPAYDLISPPASAFPDGRTLVFDRFDHKLAGLRYHSALRTTAWIKPELKQTQTRIEGFFRGRSVDILEWDESGRRYLVATQGPADPGAFYVFDRETDRLTEFVRRTPLVDATLTHVTLPYSYAGADGSRVTGLVTVPSQPRLTPIPMVVLCPDLPWQRVSADFQTEVHALADMGFVVVQLNGRGAWGLGLKQRQAITAGYDLAQIEDLVNNVANLEKIFNVNPKRVAIMGTGHGGFLALRAVQAYPDKFRCAIALDAPVDLSSWLAEKRWVNDDVQAELTRAWLGDGSRLKANPLVTQSAAIKSPILMFNYPGLEGAPRTSAYTGARSFASEVRRAGTDVHFTNLTTDWARGLPQARAEVFAQIEEFLNVNIYDFNVKMRPLMVVK